MRVVELAGDLGVAPEVLLSLLRTMRIPVPDSDAPMSDEDVSRILARLERERRGGHTDAAEAIQAVIEDAKPSAGKRRRRRVSEIPAELEPEEVAEEAEEEKEEEEEPSGPIVAEAEEAEVSDSVDEPAGVEEEVEAQAEEVEVAESEAEDEAVADADSVEATEPEAPIESAEPAEAVEEVVPEVVDEAPPASSVLAPEPVRHAAPEGPARVIRRPKTATSAGAPGQVRVQAEGYTPDGQRQQRAKKKGKKTLPSRRGPQRTPRGASAARSRRYDPRCMSSRPDTTTPRAVPSRRCRRRTSCAAPSCTRRTPRGAGTC